MEKIDNVLLHGICQECGTRITTDDISVVNKIIRCGICNKRLYFISTYDVHIRQEGTHKETQ